MGITINIQGEGSKEEIHATPAAEDAWRPSTPQEVVSATLSTAVLHPIYTIQVRMQCGQGQGSGPGIISNILKNEGTRSFYKVSSVALHFFIASSPECLSGTFFHIRDWLMTLLCACCIHCIMPMPIFMLRTSTASFIWYENIHPTHEDSQVWPPAFHSPAWHYKLIVALYQGLSVGLLRQAAYTTSCLTLYR